MSYISATELIMYAPCFLRLPISFPFHDIQQMRQPIVHHLAFDLHSIAFGNTTRGDILRPDDRDNFVGPKLTKRVVDACPGSFGGVAMTPLITAQVITHLEHRLFFDSLPYDAAVTDQLDGPFQRHRQDSITVVFIAPLIPLNPLNRVLTSETARIIMHR